VMGSQNSIQKTISKQTNAGEAEQSAGTSHHNRSMKRAEIKQPSLSASEIRQKVEAHQTGRGQKKLMINEANKQTSEFMKEKPIEIPKTSIIPEKVLNPPEQKQVAAIVKEEPAVGEHVEPSEGHVLASDVDKNDPNSPETTEKLKSILSTGAFAFNDKEREALSKILEK